MKKRYQALRIGAIVVFGLTVAFALLGGIGSSCVAFGAENYESMAGIVPYKWLYQALVVITIGLGVYGIWVTVELVRRGPRAYRDALIFLGGAVLAAGIQMFASRALRGKSQPNDVRLYWSIFVLAMFLLLRGLGAWEKLNSERGKGKAARPAAGMAIVLGGLMALTVPVWAGPTHTFEGVNLAEAFHQTLNPAGWVMVIGGGLVMAAPYLRRAAKACKIYRRAEAR